MKFLITFALMILGYSLHSTAQSTLRVMSYNIRFDSPKDTEEGNGWDDRKMHLVDLISAHQPDLIGLQEAEKHQLDFLLTSLKEYDYIGVGRTDGKEKGEYSAILFRKDRLKVKESRTFWLSETPAKPSTGWDAAYPRIVTCAAFVDEQNGKRFYHFNTHFDHMGETARIESSHQILREVRKILKEYPVILSGDFNATPESKPYEVLTSELRDARSGAMKKDGPQGTFNGFQLSHEEGFRQIDYIFIAGFEVNYFKTIDEMKEGMYPSDHFPIMTDLHWKQD